MTSSSSTRQTRFVTPDETGAPIWRVRNHINSLAVVLVPLAFMQHGTAGKSEMLAKIGVFEDETALFTNEQPTHIFEKVIVNAADLVAQLTRAYDRNSALTGYISQGAETGFGTRPWVLARLDDDTEAQVRLVWEKVTA